MAFEPPKDYIDVATRITEFRDKHPHGSLAPWDPTKPYELIKATGVAKDGKEFTATFIVVVAAAYRTPDDPAPGVGMAWEIFPGRTPYTLGSELMNAETSAWGRAIIAVGAADSKKGIASAEEVRNRAAEREPDADADADKGSQWMPPPTPAPAKPNATTAATAPSPTTNGPAQAQPTRQNHPKTKPSPGGSSPDQRQLIAIKLTEKGITTREGKLAFCTQHANRPITSSKELSWVEAAEIIRKADALPAAPGPLATKGTDQ
jgi:hypothetical protein